jgi:hypothetical protein
MTLKVLSVGSIGHKYLFFSEVVTYKNRKAESFLAVLKGGNIRFSQQGAFLLGVPYEG